MDRKDYLKFSTILTCFFLFSCVRWREGTALDMLNEIKKRFSIEISEYKDARFAVLGRGKAYRIKMDIPKSVLEDIAGHKFKNTDVRLHVERLENGPDWWNLSGKTVRFISLVTQNEDQMSVWIIEDSRTVFLEVVMHEER